jgi:hypothetical protein
MATGFDWPSLKGILNTLTFGFFREFFTYQYFLVAEKKTDGPV